MRFLVALAVLVGGAAAAASPRPGLVADLSDDALAAIARQAGSSSSPSATLDAIFAGTEPYSFISGGIEVLTDPRWFQASSVEGPGAPALEVRRWPGDSVLALYDLPPAGAAGNAIPSGLKLGARRGESGAWECRDATLAARRGDFGAVWCERVVGPTRRLGALGVPGDAGLGPAAVPDLREAILTVLKTTVASGTSRSAIANPIVPALGDPPVAADERRDGWGSLQADGFTMGLPPGVRATRLDAGVPAPRSMPFASVWLRGRFEDRDGVAVVVGDERRAGYVAKLSEPDETWLAGVAPPLGAPASERLDEARLDDTVLEWTGAKRAVVSHWKQPGFSGDWLVFRLLVSGRGVEIGLPVISGWRSLALFWIPVTYRADGLPPAPPPIDPASSLGVRFDTLRPGEAKRNSLLEGYLTVADLRLEVPRGWWPVANLDSRDGLPVTFVNPAGEVIGQLERRPAGSPELAPRKEDGWDPVAKPSTQHAAAIWIRADGAAILVAKGGHGYLLTPNGDIDARREGWRLVRERADFLMVMAARR
jgi:hypothetical protein